jgi:hypothetical protein
MASCPEGASFETATVNISDIARIPKSTLPPDAEMPAGFIWEVYDSDDCTGAFVEEADGLLVDQTCKAGLASVSQAIITVRDQYCHHDPSHWKSGFECCRHTLAAGGTGSRRIGACSGRESHDVYGNVSRLPKLGQSADSWKSHDGSDYSGHGHQQSSYSSEQGDSLWKSHGHGSDYSGHGHQQSSYSSEQGDSWKSHHGHGPDYSGHGHQQSWGTSHSSYYEQGDSWNPHKSYENYDGPNYGNELCSWYWGARRRRDHSESEYLKTFAETYEEQCSRADVREACRYECMSFGSSSSSPSWPSPSSYSSWTPSWVNPDSSYSYPGYSYSSYNPSSWHHSTPDYSSPPSSSCDSYKGEISRLSNELEMAEKTIIDGEYEKEFLRDQMAELARVHDNEVAELVAAHNDAMSKLEAVHDDMMAKASAEAANSTLHPCSIPITLTSGWTWVGFTLAYPTDITEAMSGYEASHGDIVKTLDRSATYYTDFGWFGSLSTIYPGQGLKIRSAKGGAIAFPCQ